MSECEHQWRQVMEEFLLGGYHPAFWECVKCDETASTIGPEGLPGERLKGAYRLVGPHGGCGNCADGSVYKEQILDGKGTLLIRRPDGTEERREVPVAT